MGHIGLNLKLLRKNKGITQQQLADFLGVKRPVIGAYEEERAEPKMDTLKKIARFFEISLEDLTGHAVNEEWFLEKVSRKEPGARILSITTGQDEVENIELVPVRASAGYLNGYSDPEFISTLPRFRLPMLQGGTFRAFELKGDSMLPLLPGTFIIGEYVDNWSLIREGDTYVLISSSDGIVYKRVREKVIEPAPALVLGSDNTAYSNYTLDLGEMLEVWKAKAYISMSLPAFTG